jgi:hypothetical protein
MSRPLATEIAPGSGGRGDGRGAAGLVTREPLAAALAVVAIAWCAIRFIGLADVPRGYWMDETLGAVHVRCLAETGATDGKRWPLFPWAHGGGVFGPTYIYLALAWSRLFGSSIASLRAIAATANVVTIAGLVMIGRRLGGWRLAVTAAVAGALSPWSFQFSRIAWDPPLGPAFLVWGTALLLLAPARRGALALAGVAMALAMYSYTPTRLQAVLWLPLVLAVLWRRRKIDTRGVLVTLSAFAVAAAPLVVLMLGGTINARIRELWILSPAWRAWSREYRGATPEPLFLLFTFFDNMQAHLRPSFLLLWGDGNLRHSTHASGVLGAVDLLALVLVAGAAIGRLRADAPATVTRHDALVARLLVAGALLGIAPAALCWEGIPHALRAIGAWPFTSLLSALILARAWARWRWVGPLLLGVSLVYSGLFLSAYFGRYRGIDPQWFHPDLKEAVERAPRRSALETLTPFVRRPGYSWAELHFYLMDHDGLGCEEASHVASATWMVLDR